MLLARSGHGSIPLACLHGLSKPWLQAVTGPCLVCAKDNVEGQMTPLLIQA